MCALPLLPAVPFPSARTPASGTGRGVPPGSPRALSLIPVLAKTILQPVRTPGWPCARATWSINPYRGCEIGCVYCHARFGHEILDGGDWQAFERRIRFKEGAGEVLGRELARLAAAPRPATGSGPSPGGGGGPAGDHPPAGARRTSGRLSIAVGTVTDPYQPVEERLRVTRGVLEAIAAAAPAGLEVAITTKSDLVLRDLDLLEEISRRCPVRINFTVTTMDRDLARALEPGAPSPRARLDALAAVRRRGIEAGVFLMPLIPGVNDSEPSIGKVAREAAAAGASYLADSPLLLRPQAAEPFFRFLRRSYPQLERAYREAFADGARAPERYRGRVRARAARARRAAALPPWPGDRSPAARPAVVRETIDPTIRQLEIPGL